jgi:hypothetical protein
VGEEVAGPSEEVGVFHALKFGVGLFGMAAVAGDSVEEFFVGHGGSRGQGARRRGKWYAILIFCTLYDRGVQGDFLSHLGRFVGLAMCLYSLHLRHGRRTLMAEQAQKLFEDSRPMAG